MSTVRTNNLYSVLAIVSTFFVFGLFAAVPQSADALGLTPPEISQEDILKNTRIKQTVQVYKSAVDFDENVPVRVIRKGDDANMLESEDSFIIPAGQSFSYFDFYLVPRDAANGEYDAAIQFLQDPPQVEGEGAVMGIVSGVILRIGFSVGGEEKLEYSLESLSAADTEVDRPLILSYTVKNTGNVTFKPGKIEFTFTDQADSANVVEATVSGEDIKGAEPGGFTSGEVVLEDHGLIPSKYIATGDFFFQGENVGTLESQIFRVFKTGTLAQSGDFIAFDTNKEEYAPGSNIKMTGTFQNTGDVAVQGVLVVEVVSHDDEIIDILRSDPLLVSKNEQSFFTLLTNAPDINGAYIANAYVEYGNKKSDILTADFTVTTEAEGGDDIEGGANIVGSIISIAGGISGEFIVIVVLSVLILFFAAWKRKKKDEEDEDNSVQQTGKFAILQKIIPGMKKYGSSSTESQVVVGAACLLSEKDKYLNQSEQQSADSQESSVSGQGVAGLAAAQQPVVEQNHVNQQPAVVPHVVSMQAGVSTPQPAMTQQVYQQQGAMQQPMQPMQGAAPMQQQAQGAPIMQQQPAMQQPMQPMQGAAPMQQQAQGAPMMQQQPAMQQPMQPIQGAAPMQQQVQGAPMMQQQNPAANTMQQPPQ